MGVRHFVLRGGVTCVTCRINIYAWHTQVCLYDSLICATYLMDMCDMSHSYLCVTWLMNVRWRRRCDMTHSNVWHYIVISALHLNIYTWHDSRTCEEWWCTSVYVRRLIHMCDMTHVPLCVTWCIHACERWQHFTIHFTNVYEISRHVIDIS